MKYHQEIHENSYAELESGENVYIAHVERGKRGYRCQGCKKPMVAVHSEIENRRWYFRHHVSDVRPEERCTYSDETYRHKLAKEILQQLKHVKVPAVFKFPPKGVSGLANKISDAKFINAHKISVEIIFYEDENGKLCWGKKGDAGERNSIIIPDVTFFNAEGTPILFIELAATHKVDRDKLMKLRRLQIDTIEIAVPRDSPDEIKKSITTSSLTKWLYNHEEYTREYIFISNPHSEGVSGIDEHQRKLFEETYECRTAAVGNLIRAIKRNLGTEQYKQIVSGFSRELSNIGEDTTRHRKRLHDLQAECRRNVEEKYKNEEDKIKREENDFEESDGKFIAEQENLEGRYFGKRKEIDRDIIQFEQAIRRIENRGSEIESRRKELSREIERIERELDQQRGNIEQELKAAKTDIGESIGRESETVKKLRNPENILRKEYKLIEEDTRRGYNDYKAREEEEIRKIDRNIEGAGENLESRRRELTEEYERLRIEYSESVKTRTPGRMPEFTRKLQAVINAGALLYDFEAAQKHLRRIRTAWECFKDGAYKS